MPLPLLFAAALVAAQPTTEAKPLGFGSVKLAYAWDQLLPVKLEVDGLKVNTIFFNRREIVKGPLKGATFGVRAQVEVTNTSSKPKSFGCAVAVLDEDGQLLGVATGGTRFRGVRPGTTDTFDLDFSQVLERLPKGKQFLFSLELAADN